MSSGSKKVLVISIFIAFLGVSILIMVNNKAKVQKKARSTEVMKDFPVMVAKVSREKLDDNLSLVGTTYGMSEVIVSSETQGRVISVNFDIGDNISAGKVLAQVDDELKKASLMNAEANYNKTKKDYERYEKLFQEKSVNEVQLEQSKLAYKIAESQYIIAKRQLNDTKINSPVSGVVTMRNIEVGTLINPGSPVASIVNISNLKVKVFVSERDVFKLKTNDKVEVTVNEVYPGVIFTGRIKSINVKGDETHTYLVEIALPNNSTNPLKAGMFARVHFKSTKSDETLVMPRSALVGSVLKPQTYIVKGNIAYLKNIVVGSEAGDKIEVLQGLNENDIVVSNGQINLKDGIKITVVK